MKGQGTSDKSELSQSGEASDELSAWLSGPGRPDLWTGPIPDNQRKARRLKQKRDQTTAQAQSNSTGSDLKINLNLVLTGLIEF